jgi:HSP20 family protein
MFPFGKDKGIRKPSLFGDFDSFFAGFEEFDKHTEAMLNAAQEGKGHSYVYGYRAYTGEDGNPVVEEYSNIPGFKPEPGSGGLVGPACGAGCAIPPASAAAGDTIEPYHDVLAEDDHIKVIVEMPGVVKEEIRLQSHGRRISVKADGKTRKYAADIETPDFVESKPKKAQYKNGVLEITYAKAQEPTDVAVE